jgi:hypothetical protein
MAVRWAFIFSAVVAACTSFGAAEPTGPEASNGASDAGPHFVFVTSGRFTGAEVTDEKCQQASDRSSLLKGRTFKAWISNHVGSAKSRLTPYGPWYLPADAGRVAQDLDTLVERAIDIDENGRPVDTSDIYVWTGTNKNWATSQSCDDWSSADVSKQGTAGRVVVDSGWTEFVVAGCNESHHLYCFEQPTR